MAAFRALLLVIVVALAAYTLMVVASFGPNFLPAYFVDLARLDWTGQFVLDFTFLGTLAALWVAWRNRFSASGIALALLTIPFVSMLIGSYLLYLTFKERGDFARILLGDRVPRRAS